MVPFMSAIDKILRLMQRSPTGVRYAQLTMVCTYYFGDPRQAGTSHAVLKPLGQATRGLTFKIRTAILSPIR